MLRRTLTALVLAAIGLPGDHIWWCVLLCVDDDLPRWQARGNTSYVSRGSL